MNWRWANQVRLGLLFAVCTARLFAAAAGDESFLRRYAATYRFSLGRPTAITLTPDGGHALFLRSGPRDFVRSLYEVDAATGAERLLLSAEQLLQGQAEQLSAEELARRERMRLAARGIAGYELSRDGARILVPLSGKLFVVERATGAARELATGQATVLDPRLSPDGNHAAWVAAGDLFVAELSTNEVRALTTGATDTLTRGLAEFVAQEEMDRMHGYWWSPDSRQILYQETDTAAVELLEIADPAHPERPPQAWRYPRAGTRNASVRLFLSERAGGTPREVLWDRESFPYLANVCWEKDAPLVILVQNRAQTVLRLLEVDRDSGTTSLLHEETDAAWVNLDASVPRWIPDGALFLWRTESRGAAQLELRRRDGTLVRPLHDQRLVLRELLAIDERGEWAYFLASDEPTSVGVYRVPLKQSAAPTLISPPGGVHSATFSRTARAWVDTQATPDGTITQTIRQPDGGAGPTLASRAEAPDMPLNLEWVAVGQDELRGVFVRPRDFRRGQRYPVIVHVYGGPHSQMVTQAGSRYVLAQWMANRGYIVVSLDGRGTPGRTRDWERAIKGDLIELPLADQVRGLQELGQRYPELDLKRVGIFGWSFGGYFSAVATCRRPDVFRAGVAGAPVTDWRDYDTHYTERYLGLPEANPGGYAASSALTTAQELRQPLLVIHGTADDNVYFLHSLKLTDALFRAGKAFEFLPLVGMTHMVTEPAANEMLYGRIMDGFDRALRPTAQAK